MESGSVGYIYLGIPERLAGVLWATVQDMQRSLSRHGDSTWALLTCATLSRCVLHFACVYRERGGHGATPELACAEVFELFAQQIAWDTTASEWKVPLYMVPVVSGAIAACGDLVIERMQVA